MSHSVEIRKQVLSACDSGKYSRSEICALFNISLSSLKRWLIRKRSGDSLSPRRSHLAGRQKLIDAEGLKTLKIAVETNPSMTLAELSALFKRKHKILVGRSVLSRALQSLNLRYKKISLKSAEQCSDAVKKKR